MKFKKLALITAFGLFTTSVIAGQNNDSATININGDIDQKVKVSANQNEVVTLDNVANNIDVDIEANVSFTIAVTNDSSSQLTHTNTTSKIDYTLLLKNGTNSVAAGDVNPRTDTKTLSVPWILEVTTTGVDASTLAGDYTDVLTITIEAS